MSRSPHLRLGFQRLRSILSSRPAWGGLGPPLSGVNIGNQLQGLIPDSELQCFFSKWHSQLSSVKKIPFLVFENAFVRGGSGRQPLASQAIRVNLASPTSASENLSVRATSRQESLLGRSISRRHALPERATHSPLAHRTVVPQCDLESGRHGSFKQTLPASTFGSGRFWQGEAEGEGGGKGEGIHMIHSTEASLARGVLPRSFSVTPELDPVNCEPHSEPDSEAKSRPAGYETGQGSDKDKDILGTLPPTKEGEKPRVVVLGTGWAGARFMKELNTKIYDVVCISPRNHMVFTPLLASTCVGTLEFRSVAEPIRNIQPALSRSPGSFYFLGECTHIDPTNHEVTCRVSSGFPGRPDLAPRFRVAFDLLVLAAGAQASTFGIPGVRPHATFLREVSDAQAIRRRLLTNLMTSDTPGLPQEEKERLVHCVVVGGGPTGVEFSGELSDFIRRDVRNKYTHVKDLVKVTLIEANEILSSFDVRLRHYAAQHLQKSGVRLVRGMVKAVHADHLELTDGSEVKYGVLVWSTGVGPSDFVQSLPFEKSPGGRIAVDEYLRVMGEGAAGPVEDIFALGDCAGYAESTGKHVLPALAQVAERQGKYLARLVNRVGQEGGSRRGSMKGTFEKVFVKEPFVYRHLGSMAAVGRYKALVDLRESKEARGISLAGFFSWLIWRSAYLTRVVSWRNRFYVAINWATTFVFGRDISRI